MNKEVKRSEALHQGYHVSSSSHCIYILSVVYIYIYYINIDKTTIDNILVINKLHYDIHQLKM